MPRTRRERHFGYRLEVYRSASYRRARGVTVADHLRDERNEDLELVAEVPGGAGADVGHIWGHRSHRP
jgi:hypothetical protein